MKVIVGLGNPGKEYEKTRHNIGFRVIDEFGKENNFAGFKLSKKFNSLISEGKLDGEKIILAKPQTFMNLSGKSVKILYTAYKIQNTNLWVVHDDIDLPLGEIKIVKNRGAAGHKGVESIIKELKTKNFIRFRLGIKPRSTFSTIIENVDGFVLQKFNKGEERVVKKIIKKTIEAVEITIREGVEKTMTKYNT